MNLEDFDVDLTVIAYDDWFVPDLAPTVIAFYGEFEQWEHDAILAAEAVYAANFLCPN